MNDIEPIRVPVSEGELYAERAGSGTPIVLLHAGVVNASMWDEQMDALADRHTVIRYDGRSHGRSSTATVGYRPEEDLLELLDFFEIPAATLLGNSFGGATSIAFALMSPERVTSLVLSGPGIMPMKFTDPFVLEQHREQAAAFETEDAERYIEAFLRLSVDGPYRQPADTDPRIRDRCHEMSAGTVAAHYTATGQFLERDTLSFLEQITTPAQFIIGELELSDLHRVAEEAVRRMPTASLEIMPGCGHMHNMESPKEFNELVLRHLAATA